MDGMAEQILSASERVGQEPNIASMSENSVARTRLAPRLEELGCSQYKRIADDQYRRRHLCAPLM